MDKLNMINNIKSYYDNGGNIIQYLKNIDNRTTNTLEDILISYDFQAGSYNKTYIDNIEIYQKYHESIAEILNCYIPHKSYTICEAGVGEGTTFLSILNRLQIIPKMAYGFDISWSRIAEGLKFDKQSNNGEPSRINKRLFVGDIFDMPFGDDSVDIVYTAHALEPNGGSEEKLLKELYRVASKYVILFEPIYELAGYEAKKRMDYHGYVRGLKDWANKLGYNVVRYEMLATSLNELNPTGVIVIEKNVETKEKGLCDPVSKKELDEYDDCLFCRESLLSYPKIKGIACLTKQNAILTTKLI